MSEDDRDDSRKVGLWVVFTTVAVLLLGVIGYAVMRTSKPAAAPTVSTVAVEASGVGGAVADAASAVVDAGASAVGAVAGGAAAALDKLVDFAVSGDALSTVHFASGSNDLAPAEVAKLESVLDKLKAEPGKKVLLSGYHDASGDAQMNAELAKNRAKAVRAALTARGVEVDRVLLRKPEVTVGGADAAEARRVEIRLVDAP